MINNCGYIKFKKALKISILAWIFLISGFTHPVISQVGGLAINEILSSNSDVNADEDGDFEDWIELYNYGSLSINLEGFGLTDDPANTLKWVFPDIIINPGEFLLIWASGKNRVKPGDPLHTNFSVSAAGEIIILSHPDGTIVDELPPINLRTDISYGRVPDGSDNWFFFDEPTPGASNNTKAYPGILDKPVFSFSGGFYSQPFDLNIYHPEENVQIYYTLDGSIPDPENLNGNSYLYKNQYPRDPGQSTGGFLNGSYKSHLYSEPIPIHDISADLDKLTQISSTYDYTPNYFPSTPVKKGTVVRAKAVKEGAISSKAVTNTYFLYDDEMNNYSLPVLSINIQEDRLFDYYSGIYVAGTDFDEWRAQNPDEIANGGRPANYRRRGDEWEHPAHMEVFLPGSNQSALNQDMGIRIHGGWSRAGSLKSFRLYARGDYEENYFEFPFFDDRPFNSYKRLILRNSGNDRGKTFFRDAVIHKITGNLNFDIMAYQPSIIFINGEYWGLLNIRERIDKYYLASLHDVNPDNLDILTGRSSAKEGDNTHFMAMLSYIEQNDMKVQEHYEYIKTQMDISNFIDYQIAQIYIANTDWPHNNIDFWRLRTDQYTPDSPEEHDGRWRWIMFDTDFGFGGVRNYSFNSLEYATREVDTEFPNRVWSTVLLRTLLTNDEFRLNFISRFADLLNSTFIPERMLGIIDDYKSRIEPEMPAHIHRWKSPGSITIWNSNVKVMQDFARYRHHSQRRHITDYFDLEGTCNITLDVDDQANGFIRINTIDIKNSTDGIAEEPYPWTGIYYKGVPLTVEARAREGYVFSHWEGDQEGHSPTLSFIPETSEAYLFKAHFEKLPDPVLIHYWDFNSLPDGTFTIVNADYSLIDSASLSYPGTGDGYMDRVTPGTLLNAQMHSEEGYALRLRNPSDTRELMLITPSTGFENLELSYAVQRTSNGAEQQQFFYSINGGTDWVMSGEAYNIQEGVYNIIQHDLSTIEEVNDNPDLRFKILFPGDNASGTSGNQRIDNLCLFGFPTGDINLPPAVVNPVSLQYATEMGQSFEIDLNHVFSDPDGDKLVFHISGSGTPFVDPVLIDNLLTITPLQRGDVVISIKAYDGINDSVTHQFRILIYPQAFQFDDTPYIFNHWSLSEPEYSYPPNMLFLQSDVDDPGLETPLLYPYFIEHDDYHANDVDKAGFPYALTGRTRINALEDGGISFINTGRGRDLGGALLAVNTRGISKMNLAWTAGTVLQNSRSYGIRLQYRKGITGSFQDLLVDNQILEYLVNSNGHHIQIGPVELPEHLMDQEYVQLLWRYYFREGSSGQRAELKLDNILLTPEEFVNTDNTNLPDADIYNAGMELIVNVRNNTHGLINVYSLMGLKVFSGSIHSSGRHIFEMNHLVPGLYIVRLETNEGYMMRKIFIR